MPQQLARPSQCQSGAYLCGIRGWYQEEGKEPVELKPGVTVVIPEGVKHWHGAARNSWMQHLTYNANVGENVSNEWLEPVTDEEYNKLK